MSRTMAVMMKVVMLEPCLAHGGVQVSGVGLDLLRFVGVPVVGQDVEDVVLGAGDGPDRVGVARAADMSQEPVECLSYFVNISLVHDALRLFGLSINYNDSI